MNNQEAEAIRTEAIAASIEEQIKLINHILRKTVSYFLDGQRKTAIDYLSYIKNCLSKNSKQSIEPFSLGHLMIMKNDDSFKVFFPDTAIDNDYGKKFFETQYKQIQTVTEIPLQSSPMKLYEILIYLNRLFVLRCSYYEYANNNKSDKPNKKILIPRNSTVDFFRDIFQYQNLGPDESILFSVLKDILEFDKNRYSDCQYLVCQTFIGEKVSDIILFFIECFNEHFTTKLTLDDLTDLNNKTIQELLQKAKTSRETYDQKLMVILQHQVNIIDKITSTLVKSTVMNQWLEQITKLIPNESPLKWYLNRERDEKEKFDKEFHFFMPFLYEQFLTVEHVTEWEDAENKIVQFDLINENSDKDENYYQKKGNVIKNIISLQANINSFIQKKQMSLSLKEKPALYKFDIQKLKHLFELENKKYESFQQKFELNTYFMQKIKNILDVIDSVSLHYINGQIVIPEDLSDIKLNVNNSNANLSITLTTSILTGYFAMINLYIQYYLMNVPFAYFLKEQSKKEPHLSQVSLTNEKQHSQNRMMTPDSLSYLHTLGITAKEIEDLCKLGSDDENSEAMIPMSQEIIIESLVNFCLTKQSNRQTGENNFPHKKFSPKMLYFKIFTGSILFFYYFFFHRKRAFNQPI